MLSKFAAAGKVPVVADPLIVIYVLNSAWKAPPYIPAKSLNVD